MRKDNYTEEEVKNIIDLTYGFAMADWSVPSYDFHDYILHLQKEGKDNDLMKKEGDADSGYHKFNNPDSQSPDPVSDTLCEGDWFIGTEEHYLYVLKLSTEEPYYQHIDYYVHVASTKGFMTYEGNNLMTWIEENKKTQLTPEEFIRRAENTFNNQK